ncbi:sterol desaturase family protein [Thauera sinica]|uniref:Sterol desaturase family protein n=1 Tax=Thauera sinica TaxID=2665146 RepID=A0ABW1ANJ8_9RHOO|nr:sterol desaturase family protein [Thauera sp. K11]ATE60488.1 fatty acid hydroxylase [Thauera sp. K11]
MKRFDLQHVTTVFPHALPLPVSAGAVLFMLSAMRPHGGWLPLAVCVLAGLALWTLLEYLLHRFVLHGIEPFRRWHAQHHHRPDEPMRTPLLFSALLLIALVAIPMLTIGDRWLATGLALGLLAGHVAQEITHHALHARRHPAGHWLAACMRQHRLHHCRCPSCAYGTMTTFWDRAFGTAVPPDRRY